MSSRLHSTPDKSPSQQEKHKNLPSGFGESSPPPRHISEHGLLNTPINQKGENRSSASRFKLPPINSSNSSSPASLPLRHGFEKKADFMDIISPISATPLKVHELKPSVAESPTNKNKRKGWDQLKKIFEAKQVEWKLNAFMEDRQKDVQEGKSANEVIVYQSYWNRMKRWYINPDSKFMAVWEFFFQLAVMYYVLVFSYRLAFGTDAGRLETINVVNHVVEGYFVLHIILNFFVALKLSDGTIIYNKKVIAKEYLTGMFFWDLATIIPFEFFFRPIAFLKIFRVIRLISLFRNMNQFTDLITPIFVKGLAFIKVSDFLGSLISMVFLFILVFHFFACIWIGLGFPQYEGEWTWFRNIAGYYDAEAGTLVEGSFKVYVASLFHVAQTFATIGYGNYFGYSWREQFFSCFLLFFGILVFVVAFEKIKSIIASYYEAERRENEEVQDLDSWLNMIERKIVDHKDVIRIDLIHQIGALLRYRVDEDWQKHFRDNTQLDQLDYKSRHQLLELGLEKLKKKFYIIFRDVSHPFFDKIITKSDSRVFLPNEIIIDYKRRSKGVFLILRGSVLLSGANQKDYFTRLESGSFFGEFCFLADRKSPVHFVYNNYCNYDITILSAETEVNCLLIKKGEFENLAGKYPNDMKKLKALAYLRYKYFLLQKHQRYQEVLSPSESRGHRHTGTILMGNDPKSPDFVIEENLPLRKNFEDTSQNKDSAKAVTFLPHPDKDDLTFDKHDMNSDNRSRIQLNEEDDINLQRGQVRTRTKLSPTKLQKYMSVTDDNFHLANNSSDSEDMDEELDETDEESEDGEAEGDEDDDDYAGEENEDLNSSVIYPIEDKAYVKRAEDPELQTNYLEERVNFLQERFKKVQQELRSDVLVTLRKQKNCNKQMAAEGILFQQSDLSNSPMSKYDRVKS